MCWAEPRSRRLYLGLSCCPPCACPPTAPGKGKMPATSPPPLLDPCHFLWEANLCSVGLKWPGTGGWWQQAFPLRTLVVNSLAVQGPDFYADECKCRAQRVTGSLSPTFQTANEAAGTSGRTNKAGKEGRGGGRPLAQTPASLGPERAKGGGERWGRQ